MSGNGQEIHGKVLALKIFAGIGDLFWRAQWLDRNCHHVALICRAALTGWKEEAALIIFPGLPGKTSDLNFGLSFKSNSFSLSGKIIRGFSKPSFGGFRERLLVALIYSDF